MQNPGGLYVGRLTVELRTDDGAVLQPGLVVTARDEDAVTVFVYPDPFGSGLGIFSAPPWAVEQIEMEDLVAEQPEVPDTASGFWFGLAVGLVGAAGLLALLRG